MLKEYFLGIRNEVFILSLYYIKNAEKYRNEFIEIK